MATTRQDLLDRLNTLCASAPFSMYQSITPFDFDQQPTGRIDQAFRVEAHSQDTNGWSNYSEDRTDRFTIYIARKQNAVPQGAYRLLVMDVTSLTAAIVRDGSTGGGDYAVIDGASVSFSHDDGKEFAVARLGLPINYEVQL